LRRFSFHSLPSVAEGSPIRFKLGLKAAAFLSRPAKCLAIAVVYPEKGVTPRIVSPVKRRLYCGARHPSPIQQIKGSFQD
jgi:hypothetical protein